jgi:hypothetical protein
LKRLRELIKYTVYAILKFLLWDFCSLKFHLKNQGQGWTPMAHACNPSHSGGRVQEDHGLRTTPCKKFKEPPSHPIVGCNAVQLSSQLSGRLSLEESWFQDIPGKKIKRPPSQQKRLDMVVCTFHPSYCGKHR